VQKPQSLSSELTFVSKVLLPLLYYGQVGLVAFFVIQGTLDQGSLGPGAWGWLLGFIAMGWVMWKALANLKRVRMDESGLYISNYLREILVPFANIKTVSPSSLGDHWPRITVTFHTHTEFGGVIVFLARTRWAGWASIWRNPAESIAREIRTAVARVTGKDPTAAA
jgi:hypothetical protein